jgi:hypothetical protein
MRRPFRVSSRKSVALLHGSRCVLEVPLDSPLFRQKFYPDFKLAIVESFSAAANRKLCGGRLAARAGLELEAMHL